MGLNVDEFIWKTYEKHVQGSIKGMVRQEYDVLGSIIEKEAMMLRYLITGGKSRMDPQTVRELIVHQMKELNKSDGAKKAYADAKEVLKQFNLMGMLGREWAKKHNEQLPRVYFEKCPWVLSVALFLQKFHTEEYPAMPDWTEFFMWKVLSPDINEDEEQKGSIYIQFINYALDFDWGKFDVWYANRYGYTGEDEKSFRELYIDELKKMDKDTLTKEANRHNWGYSDVMKEISGRKMEGK